MKPVNLIPADERRGASRGSAAATGRAPYIVLGVLAALVVAVFVMVSAGNQVNEKQSQLDQINADIETANKQTDVAAVSTSALKDVAAQRSAAVSAAIDSRYDFERRLRQLSHVLPSNVSLTDLTAELTPGAASGDSSSSGDAGGGTGEPAPDPSPTFTMSVCSTALNWTTVAVTVTRMRNLDGVTKVEAPGTLSGGDSSGGSTDSNSSSGGSTGGCADTDWTWKLIVHFKAPEGSAPAPDAGGGPANAIEQAQGAAATANSANAAAGADGASTTSGAAAGGGQ